jgi:hypothetical protein
VGRGRTQGAERRIGRAGQKWALGNATGTVFLSWRAPNPFWGHFGGRAGDAVTQQTPPPPLIARPLLHLRLPYYAIRSIQFQFHFFCLCNLQ